MVRLTASLATLEERSGVRVGLPSVPDGWTPRASRRGRAQMTPRERNKLVPAVLLDPEEIANAVVMFVEDDSMAGRVMIWLEPWRDLLPLDAPYSTG